MPGRVAVDFGTTNTVAALWDTTAGAGHTLPLANLTRVMRDPQGRDFHAVPSLMHYTGNHVWVGQQVVEKQLQAAPGTFRWMKSYVGNQMKLPRHIAGRATQVDNFQASEDFLRQILITVGIHTNFAEEDVAFTLPVEAFEHYQNWLDSLVQSVGISRPRYLDEASAAALGYSAGIRSGQPFMTFDLGGGTLDVSIVRVDDHHGQPRCRSLGKAGAQLGGGAFDQWLARDAVTRAGKDPAALRSFFPHLLFEAERVKEALTSEDAVDFKAEDSATGLVIQHRYTRGAFEDLLESNGAYTKINTVLDAAEAQAREHGYDRDALQAVLMIGGTSLVPSIRRQLRTRYGERVRCDRPFDAVAVGAAAYVAGTGFDDRIRHSYALRPYDRASGQYVFRAIVPSGTPYPCDIMRPDDPKQPLVLTIKASRDQQTRLGLQVYEVAENSSSACGGQSFDLVFDQNGGARYTQRVAGTEATHREIGSPSFIHCDPPAALGAPRFLATFAIDAQRHLCVTVQDTQTGKTVCRQQPLVQLT